MKINHMKIAKHSFLFAVILFYSNCSTIRKSLRVDNTPKEKLSIAVVPAHNQVPVPVLDNIAITLLENGFNVIDRSSLQATLKENNLSLSGLTEGKNIIKLGKLINVNSICQVTYSHSRYLVYDKNNTHNIAIKIIDIETGKYIYLFQSKDVSWYYSAYSFWIGSVGSLFLLAPVLWPLLLLPQTDSDVIDVICKALSKDLKKKF